MRLKGLSRLKGIETLPLPLHRYQRVGTLVWKGFPVWRELKLHPFAQSVALFAVWKGFPVWRELKRLFRIWPQSQPLKISLKGLSRLKGIETHYCSSSRSRQLRLKGLSRLKGIETVVLQVPKCRIPVWKGFPVWRELKHDLRTNFQCTYARRSERAFPFEGNWNYPIGHVALGCERVWKGFPVWRELKLYGWTYENVLD